MTENKPENKPKRKVGGAREGAGRPKREVSEEDMIKVEQYALENCQNATIEGLMGWPNDFINKRPDISKRVKEKRQEHKRLIRESQFHQRKNPVMAIFLGKNVLGQTDKQELTGKDGQPLAPLHITVLPPSDSAPNTTNVLNTGDKQ